MSLKAGIVGLPNVGKSTLFNAITNSQIEAANYPFATIEPNVGIVELQDDRIDTLAKMVNPDKVIRATFEFTDIAGLVKGASTGQGLGNKFLANIREVDAIVQVVRCFEDKDITHVLDSVDPERDIDIINTELLLADMETINNVLQKVSRKATQTKDKDLVNQMNVATKIKSKLEQEIPARAIDLDENDQKTVKGWNLLTLKPLIYLGNVHQKHVATPEKSNHFVQMKNIALKQNAAFLSVSAQIEGEIAQLEEEDKQMFLDDLNIKKSGLDKLTRQTFKLLNLATYFTAGKQEVRAWTFSKGAKAPECAGIIHTDFEKGFIKAEVVSYDDFVAYNGENGAKAAGKYRLEGKDYIFQDGDMANFKFNN